MNPLEMQNEEVFRIKIEKFKRQENQGKMVKHLGREGTSMDINEKIISGKRKD